MTISVSSFAIIANAIDRRYGTNRDGQLTILAKNSYLNISFLTNNNYRFTQMFIANNEFKFRHFNLIEIVIYLLRLRKIP